ncbi:hypothetical protein GCM10010381_68220 [Streptomyces xantholiticus]|nr:hypothetical protein GCM10010381_68220 [Streptomyces xantholiticus]
MPVLPALALSRHRAPSGGRRSAPNVGADRTAVDDGALTDDGAIAAVVIGSGSQVVWACYVDDAPGRRKRPSGKLSEGTVVWERGARYWRLRTQHDPEGKRQAD